MRSTRISTLMAVAALMAASSGLPAQATTTSTVPRRPTPKRFINNDAEIQKWNDAVDQRKKARKAR